MIAAFDVLRVLTRTNSLYRELKTAQKEYGGDFMGRTLTRDYLAMIAGLWLQLEYFFSTDSVSLLVRVPVESD